MSIFGSIASAIFGSPHATNVTTNSGPSTTTPSSAGSAPLKPISQADVQGVLEKLAANQGEKLDWKSSIVDLMKLLKLDSSFSARKQLAKDLNYTGDTNDSAKMNIWLHAQVMQKLAASGGKVPADLLKH
jgi:hypothetical protein